MATIEQLRRAADGLPTADFPQFNWRPTIFGDWSTVAYQPVREPRVTRQRPTRRRRSLNGPVTVRRIPPRD